MILYHISERLQYEYGSAKEKDGCWKPESKDSLER